MTETPQDVSKAVVKPGQDIVASTAEALRQELKNIIAAGIRKLVVDLQGVAKRDSVGLGLLISAPNSLQ